MPTFGENDPSTQPERPPETDPGSNVALDPTGIPGMLTINDFDDHYPYLRDQVRRRTVAILGKGPAAEDLEQYVFMRVSRFLLNDRAHEGNILDYAVTAATKDATGALRSINYRETWEEPITESTDEDYPTTAQLSLEEYTTLKLFIAEFVQALPEHERIIFTAFLDGDKVDTIAGRFSGGMDFVGQTLRDIQARLRAELFE